MGLTVAVIGVPHHSRSVPELHPRSLTRRGPTALPAAATAGTTTRRTAPDVKVAAMGRAVSFMGPSSGGA